MKGSRWSSPSVTVTGRNPEGEVVFTHLQIENFKAWENTGDIELAPLTVLFGANSSGKSSLHQFLMMLRQTVESSDRRRVLHFGDSSTPVDLGSYSEAIRHDDPTTPLRFELSWRRREPLEITLPVQGAHLAGDRLSFASTISATAAVPPRVRVDAYSYTLADGDTPVLTLGSERDTTGHHTLTASGLQLVPLPGRDGPVTAPQQFHAFPDDLAARYQDLAFATDLTLALEEQLLALHYLGPLRERPGRLYRWSGEEVSHVGWRGERTIDALLAGSERRFNTRPGARMEPLLSVVARWMKTLGAIDEFTVTPIGRGRDDYEVRVRTPGATRDVLLTDVGFGVSQVLPVIASCFYPPAGSTVVMEQPEIHLHPSIQSGLADLFIEAISMREDGEARDTQFIIESHSEHLLRRLLRRVAEEEVDPDLIRCYAVSSGPAGSHLERLAVDEFGNVHNWPADFFGDPADDLIAQSRSARRRRQRSAP